MPRPLSGNQLRQLGKRLAQPGPVTDADYELLALLADFYQGITGKVTGRLRDMGIENTTRSFKSTGTIADKLRRTHLSLGEIQDLAGTRIVIDGGRVDQDRVVSRIMQAFSDCPKPPLKVDRIAKPSHGYRAIHVVVYEDSAPMEIQVRTKLQDTWAQISEKLGDIWGRGLRYGEGPDMPADLARAGAPATRAEVVAELQAFARLIDATETYSVLIAKRLEHMLALDPAARGDAPQKLEAVAQSAARVEDELHIVLRRLLESVGEFGGAQ